LSVEEERVNRQPLVFGQLGEAAELTFELFAILRHKLTGSCSFIKLGSEFVPIASQRAPTLAGDLAGERRKPGSEPCVVSERGEFSVGSEETLLSHVIDRRPVAGDGDNHCADPPRMPIVEQAKGVAVAREDVGDELGIAFVGLVHRHHPSGRCCMCIQENAVRIFAVVGKLTLRANVNYNLGVQPIVDLERRPPSAKVPYERVRTPGSGGVSIAGFAFAGAACRCGW
jgi:hypothetical protein